MRIFWGLAISGALLAVLFVAWTKEPTTVFFEASETTIGEVSTTIRVFVTDLPMGKKRVNVQTEITNLSNQTLCVPSFYDNTSGQGAFIWLFTEDGEVLESEKIEFFLLDTWTSYVILKPNRKRRMSREHRVVWKGGNRLGRKQLVTTFSLPVYSCAELLSGEFPLLSDIVWGRPEVDPPNTIRFNFKNIALSDAPKLNSKTH